MLRNFALVVLVFSVLSVAIPAQQSSVKASKVVRTRGSVLAVEDSDRVKIAADDGNVYSVVLLGVDAPDESQDYFKKAKKRLADLVNGKDVTVIVRTDETGANFAVVFAGADDVGLKMIAEGFAWYSPNRSTSQNQADREKYIQAESAARTARAGLWSEKQPVPPWTFRGETLTPPWNETSEAKEPPPTVRRSEPVPGRTYILGPRGGCYYLNDQGIKVYVKDKTLCQKP